MRLAQVFLYFTSKGGNKHESYQKSQKAAKMSCFANEMSSALCKLPPLHENYPPTLPLGHTPYTAPASFIQFSLSKRCSISPVGKALFPRMVGSNVTPAQLMVILSWTWGPSACSQTLRATHAYALGSA